MKRSEAKLNISRNKAAKSKRAISNIISTIILTGILLTILLVATFVSINILNGQMVSTEFNQAQSNMLLLDSTIQDVSLRPGAGGYVQFNERQGGIGINQTTNALSIYVTNGTVGTTTNGTDFVTYSTDFNNLIQLVYSGGSLASAAVNSSTGYTTLRGDPNTYVSLAQGLGFLRLAQDNGAKIKLDYGRVRIVSTGLIDDQGTNLVQITFIHLVKGNINAGSGTVNVMVQNVQTIPTTWSFENQAISILVQNSSASQTWTVTPPNGALRTVVVFSEIQVEVSIS
jgi:hypothetical protein